MDNKPDTIPLQVIPPGTQVTITISTDLYIRLQQLLLEGFPYKDMSHFIVLLREARSNEIKDPISFHMQAILHLMTMIEVSAKAQGLTKTLEHDLKAHPSAS